MLNNFRVRAKAALANTLLLLTSLALCYLVLEFVFFRFALPLIPFNARPNLPEVPEVLLQNTKAGYLPHHYIALLGDSYAEGLGDWLLESNGNRSRPYHSANIIHDGTGRDVVSFGKGQSGSAEGLVLRPAALFAINSCYLFPTIEEPSQIFYYFFEGNDPEDNLETLKLVAEKYGNTDAASVKRFLLEEYADRSPWRCHRHFGDMMIRMARFSYQYYVLKKDFPRVTPAVGTTLRFPGQTVRATALFGPALGFSAAKIETSLSLFDPSLAWLRQRFPKTPVTVVYIPSPLYVYVPHLAGPIKLWQPNPRTALALDDPDGKNAFDRVPETSDAICARIHAASLANGADFLDARPAFRKAAELRPIHGPIDWGHPNEYGYRALGELIVERLKGGAASTDCASASGH